MSQRYQLPLSEAQRATLEAMRDYHPKAYLREKAAALLKVAAGDGIRGVAARGLLRHRRKNTVDDWVNRYRHVGLGGLWVQAGRGRKPAFSPSAHQCRDREG